MKEVEDLIARLRIPPPPPKVPNVDGFRGGADDGGMEERLRKLESGLAVIEAKLPELATNDGVDSRVSKAETKIIAWVVGAVVLTGLGGKWLTPTPAPAPSAPQQPAPIILQIPSALSAAPAAVEPPKATPPAASTAAPASH